MRINSSPEQPRHQPEHGLECVEAQAPQARDTTHVGFLRHLSRLRWFSERAQCALCRIGGVGRRGGTPRRADDAVVDGPMAGGTTSFLGGHTCTWFACLGGDGTRIGAEALGGSALALVSLGRGPTNRPGAEAIYFRVAELCEAPTRWLVLEKSVDGAPKFGAPVGVDDSGVVAGSCLPPVRMYVPIQCMGHARSCTGY